MMIIFHEQTKNFMGRTAPPHRYFTDLDGWVSTFSHTKPSESEAYGLVAFCATRPGNTLDLFCSFRGPHTEPLISRIIWCLTILTVCGQSFIQAEVATLKVVLVKW